MARREKKPVHKVVMTEGKRNIIQQLLQEYDIEIAEDIQDALKDLLGGTIKEMIVFCKTFLHKIAKTFCRSLQLHFVGNCKPGWQSWYLPAI